MLSVYDYSDYRVYLMAWLGSKRVTGMQGQLARAMNVSSTLVSLILKSEKQLSMEQASDACDYIGLNERETDYFFLLVEYGRAGSHKLQQKLLKRIREQQQQAKKISNRVKKDVELGEQEMAIYYSSWVYTGIRNLAATGKAKDIQQIAKRLNISPTVITKVLQFLIRHGLCREEKGKITYGPAHLHVGSDSPFVLKHHQNWRLRGFQAMDQYNEDHLFYTCPMSLSKEAAEQVRKLLPKVIDDVLKIVGPSDSEEVYCFNIDWFKY